MAIQVNGTTVINDSRALTNITSVDSTTKSAIESAGVGGQTTLITDRQSFSTSNLSISLPDYTTVRILIFKGRMNVVNGESGRIRFSNSSGSVITGADYNYHETSTVRDNNYIYVGGDWPYSNDSANYNATMDIIVNNAYDSDALTSGSMYQTVNRGGSSMAVPQMVFFMSTKQRNQHISFFRQNNGSFSGYYSVWGIS